MLRLPASYAHLFAANAYSGQMDQNGKPCIRHNSRAAAAVDAHVRYARWADALKIKCYAKPLRQPFQDELP